MKNKLRLIVERKESTTNSNQNSMTGDLRGLGQDEILVNNEPLPILVCHGSYNNIQSVANKYSLEITTEAHHTTITSTRHDPSSYKAGTITLFMAAAEILNSHKNAKLHLTFKNRLADKVHDKLNSKSDAHSHQDLKIEGLHVDEFCANHLVQAGILSVTHNHKNFSAHEADSIIRSFMEPKTSKKRTVA